MLNQIREFDCFLGNPFDSQGPNGIPAICCFLSEFDCVNEASPLTAPRVSLISTLLLPFW